MASLISTPTMSTGTLERRTPTTIHSLPEDVLLKVFMRLVDEHSDSWAALHVPIGVCRQWRVICILQPLLWSHVDFYQHKCKIGHEARFRMRLPSSFGSLPMNDTDYQHPAKRAIALQIARSHSMPLFINAMAVCRVCPTEIEVFRQLLTQSHRWEAASLPMFPSIPRHGVRFPNLKKLTHCNSMYRENDLRTAIGLPAFHCGEGMTKLHSLTVVEMSTFLPNLNEFPWRQLTSLTLKHYAGNPSHVLLLLSNTPGLVRFDISHTGSLTGSYAPRTLSETEPVEITLDHLTSFALSDPSPQMDLMPITQHLRLPVLKELECNLGQSSNQTPEDSNALSYVQPIIDLIQRSSCSLTVLECKYIVPNMDITSVLQMCPDLEILSLSGHTDKRGSELPRLCAHDSVLRSLLSTSETSGASKLFPVCPKLQQLTLFDLKADPLLIITTLDSLLSGEYSDRLTRISVSSQWPFLTMAASDRLQSERRKSHADDEMRIKSWTPQHIASLTAPSVQRIVDCGFCMCNYSESMMQTFTLEPTSTSRGIEKAMVWECIDARFYQPFYEAIRLNAPAQSSLTECTVPWDGFFP